MSSAMQQLAERIAMVRDLGGAAALLGWDQETHMPPGGAEPRAHQLATLRTLSHKLLADPAVGALLDELEAEPRDPETPEALQIKLTRRDYDRATRVPTELVREMAEAGSRAVEVWKKARPADDFASFAPCLQHNIELMHRWCDCFAPFDDVYDPLIDRHEPGLTYAAIRDLFEPLKPRLIQLAAKIAARGDVVDTGAIRRPVPPDRQLAFCRQVTAAIGFDYRCGRIDLSAHPFCGGPSHRDVRLTTRFDPSNPLPGLMASIHEAGHGIHAQHMDPRWYRTSLIGSTSAIAESQSRFLENNLGRSRAFWSWLLPLFQSAYAPTFDGVDLDTAYKAVNRVAPSLIRVEADEVTYGLHIILRFELEHAALHGEVAVSDLPEAWNAKMQDYLGITPPSAKDGVLQDVHWSGGMFGYFPDYLLGSIFAVQLHEAMAADLPDWEQQVAAGQFAPILSWLEEKVQRWGRAWTLPELAVRATGRELTVEPYVAYLERKFGEIYAL